MLIRRVLVVKPRPPVHWVAVGRMRFSEQGVGRRVDGGWAVEKVNAVVLVKSRVHETTVQPLPVAIEVVPGDP